MNNSEISEKIWCLGCNCTPVEFTKFNRVFHLSVHSKSLLQSLCTFWWVTLVHCRKRVQLCYQQRLQVHEHCLIWVSRPTQKSKWSEFLRSGVVWFHLLYVSGLLTTPCWMSKLRLGIQLSTSLLLQELSLICQLSYALDLQSGFVGNQIASFSQYNNFCCLIDSWVIL